MTQTTFTDNVLVDGSQDIEQLRVQGHSTQNDPLQTWEDSAGDVLAQITGDGRLQVGDDVGLASPDALVEAHRDDSSTTKPQRGFHSLGRVSGTLATLVQWIVGELELRGSTAIDALHTALRIRASNMNTGTPTANAELRAADIEVINDSTASTSALTKATGLQLGVTNASGKTITDAAALRIKMDNDGTITKPYAIFTEGEGVVHFEDYVEVKKPAGVPGTPDTDFIRVYPKSDGKLYAKNSAGTEYDLTGGSGAPTDAKYWVSEADGDLSDEVNLGALTTGLLKHTVSGSVSTPATATSGTDYTTPTGTENLSNKTITASSLIATALSLLIGGFKAVFTHANTADRTYTLPDYNATLATLAGTETLSNKTLTTPTIASLTNAQHNHQNAAGGGQLTDAALSAAVGISKGGTGQTTKTAAMDALSPTSAKGDLLVDNGTNVVALTVGANGTHLVADSSQSAGVKWQSAHPFAVIEDQKTQNTAGGASTATTWTARTLNTEVVDADSIVSISSNLFTPIAGTYRIHMEAPFLDDGSNNTLVRIRLWNNTQSSEVIRSTNFYLSNVLMGATAFLDYVFTANGSDAFALEYYITRARATNGLGLAINETSAVERYSRVLLEKIG